MNDEQINNSELPTNKKIELHKEAENHKKGFFSLFLRQIFHGVPRNSADILTLIRDSDLIDSETKNMLEGVMEIAEQRVRDIMIPRSQMVTLHQKQTLDECLSTIVDSAHSRFPVINADKDHIEGILMAKDLLPFMFSNTEPFSIDKILRPVVIVPESKRVDHMLKEFRSQRYHMAIVVDEFGGVSGLITIEDILEVIVGEIEDEYDETDMLDIRQLSSDIFTVRGLTPIEQFNDIFSTQLSDQEVDTIGGLIMQSIGHLPSKGETIEINGYRFKVVLADRRRVIQVHVTIPNGSIEPLLTSE